MGAFTQTIAIAGAGCVLPGGAGVDDFWNSLCAGRSGIGPLRSQLFRGERVAAFGQIAEEVRLACRQDVPRNLQRYCTPAVVLGVAAARQALQEAGVDPRQGGLRFGLYSCQGGYTHPSLDAYAELLQECRAAGGLDVRQLSSRVLETRTLDPFLVLKSLSNGLSGVVSLAFGLEGECNAYMQGVAGNQAALREACAALRSRRIDAALVVAAGSELDALALAELARAGVIGTQGARAFRPFDRDGEGGVAGEGAAALLLRRGEDMPAGPRIAIGSIAAHAELAALELPGEPVDLLVCNGTGIPAEDRLLSGILARSRPRHATCAQPVTGLLSAAPSLADLIVARSSLLRQCVPPVASLERPVSADLPFVTDAPQPAPLRSCAVVGRDDNGFSACYRLAYTDGY